MTGLSTQAQNWRYNCNFANFRTLLLVGIKDVPDASNLQLPYQATTQGRNRQKLGAKLIHRHHDSSAHRAPATGFLSRKSIRHIHFPTHLPPSQPLHKQDVNLISLQKHVTSSPPFVSGNTTQSLQKFQNKNDEVFFRLWAWLCDDLEHSTTNSEQHALKKHTRLGMQKELLLPELLWDHLQRRTSNGQQAH